MTEPKTIAYDPPRVSPEETVRRSAEFRRMLDGRRTVRMFSRDPVPRETIENILAAAGTAPSGAHLQPWTFVAVSDADLKARMREVAEVEEKRFYGEIAPEEWLRALAPLGTDWVKTHLTDAPWVIVVFAQDYGLTPEGEKRKHYYVQESTGIAVGFMLAAIRAAGLVALTHTPSPMRWLSEALGRPPNERAYVVVPVGYPAPKTRVPDLRRKELVEFVVWR